MDWDGSEKFVDKQISLSLCAFVEFYPVAGENYYLNIHSCVLYLPQHPADDSSLIISKAKAGENERPEEWLCVEG